MLKAQVGRAPSRLKAEMLLGFLVVQERRTRQKKFPELRFALEILLRVFADGISFFFGEHQAFGKFHPVSSGDAKPQFGIRSWWVGWPLRATPLESAR